MLSRNNRGLAAISGVALSALLLAGCNSSSTTSDESAGAQASNASMNQNSEPTTRAYAQFLDTISSYRFDINKPEAVTGTYDYSLVDTNHDDEPELVVRVNANQEESNIFFFYPASDGKNEGSPQVRQMNTDFAEGAASAGGARYEIHERRGTGELILTQGLSGTGMYTSTVYSFNGNDMEKTDTQWNYRSDRKPAELTQQQSELKWFDSKDHSGLTAWVPGKGFDNQSTAKQGKPNPTVSASPHASSEQPAAQSGQQLSAASPAENSSAQRKAMEQFPYYAPDWGSGPDSNFVRHTSDGFARAVYLAFIDHYATTGSTDAVVNATSPANGQTYAMTCSMSWEHNIAFCEGGNRASVSIFLSSFPVSDQGPSGQPYLSEIY